MAHPDVWLCVAMATRQSYRYVSACGNVNSTNMAEWRHIQPTDERGERGREGRKEGNTKGGGHKKEGGKRGGWIEQGDRVEGGRKEVRKQSRGGNAEGGGNKTNNQ